MAEEVKVAQAQTEQVQETEQPVVQQSNNERECARLHGEIQRTIEQYNAALESGDYAVMRTADATLGELEAEYAKVKKALTFEQFNKSENPRLTAVTTREYAVIGHKADSESGTYEMSTRQKFVDLADYCKKVDGKTPMWVYQVAKLGYLIAIRNSSDLKVAAENLKQIKDNYTLSEIAKKLELGETVASNTKVVKLLQTIIDGILFEDDGKGKNKHKVCNHDVVYLEHGFMKLGKKAGSLSLPSEKTIERMVADIAWRVVTGSVYSVNGTIIGAK